MAQGILVFVEQREGKIRKSSLEALSEARRRGDKFNEPVVALLVGENVRTLVPEVSKCKPDRIMVADNSVYARYSSEGYAHAFIEAVKRAEPRFVFGACTAMAKDLIPRVATHFDAPCASDVVELKEVDGSLLAVRSMYSAKCYGTIEFQSALVFITLRANLFPMNEPVSGPETVCEEITLPPERIRCQVVDTHVIAGEKVELSEARIVVSGGRGIKGPENWGVLNELCDVLGAALGASRAVVDAGWIDHQHQVGQTGKTVSPQLYIACGISGAIQHLAGMSSSKVIVAINKDPDAPIFKHATYGVAGDVFEIVPRLTEECRKLKQA